MSAAEIALWDALFWLLYAPCALLLRAIGKGDLAGSLVIGAVLTVVLSLYIAAQEDEAVIVHVPVREATVEVHYEEETAGPIGREPGVAMRTDVNLRQLDAADDDILS